MDPVQRARIHKKLALAIYTTGRPFNMFENGAWLDLFEEFNYVPPSADQLANELLDEVYLDIFG